MQHPCGYSIQELTREQHESVLPGLAELLVDSVDDGASVGFLGGLTRERALGWWQIFLADASMTTWIARDCGGVAGVVGLYPAQQESAPHRADVRMLLVHRRARGQGLARALLAALEREAVVRGRWLLVLDTETGSTAETVYRRLGWQPAGIVPDHTLDPDGTPEATIFFWKRLSPEER
jgi:GNAT superfamily N-acetyltransferase